MTDPLRADAPDAFLSAVETIDLIAAGELTAMEAMERCLARIADMEPDICAFVDFRSEEALAAAKAADDAPHDGRGPLHGLPIGIKEVFDVAGMRCCWGTPIHRDRIPARDAVAIRRLKEAGAIIVGTLVSTEYAIAAAGPTVNPHDLSRTPGGSSSGPAAAVASGMLPCALGSQTVGSIVRPACYCGILGLKPTYGAIPGGGGMPLSPQLDHPGLLARTTDDIALLCRSLFGPNGADPLSRDIAPPGRNAEIDGMRVLVAQDIPPQPVSAVSRNAVNAAARMLAEAGAAVDDFCFGDEFSDNIDILYTIMCRDMARAHGGDYRRARGLMSDHLGQLIERGLSIGDEEYRRNLAVAKRLREKLTAMLGNNTMLLSPAVVDVAPPLDQGTGSNRAQALWSLVGLPVIAIPCGGNAGLPIGVQAGAGPGREDLLLAAASAIGEKQLSDIHHEWPRCAGRGRGPARRR